MKKMRTFIVFVCVYFTVASTVYAAESQTALVTDELYKDMEQLKYPKVSEVNNREMEVTINKNFHEYIKASYQELKENKKQANQHGFQADYQTAYEVKYNTTPRLSILTSNYIFSGGAHGNTIVQSLNYDIEAEKRVYLTDILTTEKQIKAVRDYVWEYAIERPDIFYPDLKKEDIKLTKDTAFYFVDDGIILVFQQYEIAPYVSGNQEIHIPAEVYEKS
ncbi:hypothetical protein JCM21714_3408 [Gracilibacillus boraciitolerans JCM 21714]|uniref:DUF3298/DUF4163 domain-containing protein n=1 Tax=Gracilibacillus boraciitolerans JCM 21714 TaxID=1298598 RepID=W4VN50_9BACI|nr:DUF3298 and DUF4163 domain-containing protein [Gracilibacillus boraciitolerans]GAE94268.1 hypothetical protein JCM21714_3408 [Gracilibacillus boraciitolerans JCM 21714]